MAELNINSLEKERDFELYRQARNEARDAIAYGVYPNCVSAVGKYISLETLLAGDLSEFAAFHNSTMADVLPHITTIRTAMQTIIATVEAIDASSHAKSGIDIFGTVG